MPKKALNPEITRRAIETIAEKVAKIVSPTPREAGEEKEFASKLSSLIAKELKNEAEIRFVGSAARDTGLADDMDIDLFVTFPSSFSRENIIRRTLAATKKVIKAKWLMKYAEHPYLQTKIGKFQVEVIPCFRIAPHEPIKSAVDRSPLHMDYLQKKLSEKQKRDVRVLKKLLKNAGLYGAEVEVQGFSGLVCEQLVLNYRSLAGLVENAKDWRAPVVVDIEAAYPNKKDAIEKFPESAIVLIDAIDRNRNAAAAISATNASKFVCLCRAFWQTPSNPNFFFRKLASPNWTKLGAAIGKRSHSILGLELNKPDEVEDILVPQLRKTTQSIARHLQLLDFRVLDSTSFSSAEKSYMVFELESDSIPEIKKIQGPPVSDAVACERFLSVHSPSDWLRGPYVEGERILVEKQRKTTDANEALKQVLGNPVKAGAAPHLVATIKKAKILDGQQLIASKSLDSPALQALEYFINRKDWWLAK